MSNIHSVIPVLLVILDGVGCRDAAPDNPVSLARKPNWDRFWQEFAHTTIDASERSVGLPSGQMGNSEVGHLNIGAGRVIYQDFTRIDRAIETGEFATNPVLAEAVATARRNNATLHVLGFLSPGGVHRHARQIAAMVRMAADGGAPHVRVHAFLDGRDTAQLRIAETEKYAHVTYFLAASRRSIPAKIASWCLRPRSRRTT